MEKRSIKLSYDKVADVLYISFGEPQKGIAEETESGILIRRHPKSRQVIGITIIDFEKRFSTTKEQTLPITLEEVASLPA